MKYLQNMHLLYLSKFFLYKDIKTGLFPKKGLSFCKKVCLTIMSVNQCYYSLPSHNE